MEHFVGVLFPVFVVINTRRFGGLFAREKNDENEKDKQKYQIPMITKEMNHIWFDGIGNEYGYFPLFFAADLNFYWKEKVRHWYWFIRNVFFFVLHSPLRPDYILLGVYCSNPSLRLLHILSSKRNSANKLHPRCRYLTNVRYALENVALYVCVSQQHRIRESTGRENALYIPLFGQR